MSLVVVAGLTSVLLPGNSLEAGEITSESLDKDPHLVGWWRFDETSGKTCADSSKNKRNGTLTGSLSFDKNSGEGRIGKALKFGGGEENYVAISGYKGVTGTQARSVAAWIKTESPRGEILSWGHDDYGKMFLFCFISQAVGVTPSGGYYYMEQKVHDGEWHHVVAVVREAELPNLHDDVTLYLDGDIAEVDGVGLLDLWPLDTGSDLDVMIGRSFRGLLDDVRIYDRPLSEDEVAVLGMKQSEKDEED